MKKTFAILFISVFLLHVAVIIGLQSIEVPFKGIQGSNADYQEYQEQAVGVLERISEGNLSVRGLGIDHFFPVVVGYLYKVFGASTIVGQLFNGFVAAIASLLLFLITKRLGGSIKASFFLAFAGSLYPTYLLFSSLFLEDALVILFTLAALLAGLIALESWSLKRVLIWYGLVLLAAEFRSFMGLFLGIAFLISYVLLYKASYKEKLGKCIGVALLVLLIPFAAQYVFSMFEYGDYGHSLNGEFEHFKDLGNGLLAIPGFLYSFLRTILGPFPWNFHSTKDWLYLAEVIPWLLAVPFVVKGIHQRAKRFSYMLFLPVFSFVVYIALSLFIEDTGTMMRLRIPVILSLIPFLAVLMPASSEKPNMPGVCPVCKQGQKFRFLREHTRGTKAYSLQKPTPSCLYECSSCKAQFWVPFENPGHDWYEETYQSTIGGKPSLYRDSHKRFIERYGKDIKGKRILDVGCGTGEFLGELQKRGADVWGVDFNKDSIEKAQTYFGLQNVFVMPLEEFLAKYETLFDFVCAFEVLEHVTDPVGLLKGMGSKLAPDGKLILSTPSRERMLPNLNEWDYPPHHLTRWNTEAFSNILSLADEGLKLSRVEYVEGIRVLIQGVARPFTFGVYGKLVKAGEERGIKKISVFVIWAATIKNFIIGTIPATILWIIGRFQGRTGGTMVIEAIKQ